MSIFDAFRGVPDIKPRKAKTCSCCNKVHTAKNGPKHGKQANSCKKPADSNTKEDDLREDDRIMLRMKAENPTRPWSDIIEATSFKDKGEAVARWKEIERKNQEDSNEGVANRQEQKKKKKTKDRDPDREARDAKNREEGLRKKVEAKKNAEVGGEDGNSKTEDKMVGPSIYGQFNGKAKNDQSDTNDMKALADGYDKKKWHMIASKHYDKTGQRITATQAKAMAEGK